MKIAAMSLLAVLVGGASSSSAAVVEAAAADKPNIVMLFVDDLGYGSSIDACGSLPPLPWRLSLFNHAVAFVKA